MARQALGRGLEALIPAAPAVASGDGSREVAIDDIRVNPFQPRTTFAEDALDELAASIREKGVIQPVLVRPHSEAGWELVAGERRLRASKKAGLATIPVVVRDVSDEESMEIALIENIQRKDLSPIERARAYRSLMEKFGHTQADLAKGLGVARASLANTLRLLSLPARVQDKIHDGKLSSGHAKALLSMSGRLDIEKIAARIIKDGLSVREVESIGRKASGREGGQGPARGPKLDPNVRAVEEELQRSLGTRVRLVYRGGRGRIEIHYYSDEGLEALLDQMISDRHA